MGKGKNRNVQKKVMQLMSNMEVWSNQQLYVIVSQMKYGPDSWTQFHAMLGQLAKYTPRRLSETHEIIKLENHRTWGNSHHRRYTEYCLQER